MNKLILIMVLLFSAIATAEDNLKYKRDHFENMQVHFRCKGMATWLGLDAARITKHFQNGMYYTSKAWDSLSEKKRSKFDKLSTFYLYHQSYQKGWAEGFFATFEDSESENYVYNSLCGNDVLLFSYNPS